MKQLCFLIFFLTFSFNAFTQYQGNVYEQRFTPTIYLNSTDTMLNPWVGGINSVQVQHADLNLDGKKDIVLFDAPNNVVHTYINIGLAGQIKYKYEPKYAKNFPKVWYYLILKDYNCDGIPDLFHRGYSGVEVWTGKYVNSELKFTVYKQLFFPASSGQVNVYVQPNDIPSIEDFDHDGDLDIIAFDVLGYNPIHYVNKQVEQNAICDSILMDDVPGCWGHAVQSNTMAYNLNLACKPAIIEKDETEEEDGSSLGAKSSKRHSGNCLCEVDIDGDRVYDMLSGNTSFDYMQFLHNGGDSINADIDWQDTLWQATGTELYLPQWPCPFRLDIDNDNDFDLVFSTNKDAYDFSKSQETSNLLYYKNLGTNANPNFVYNTNKLFMDDMVEWGSYSYPVVFDIDKDGKKDIVLGNEGFFDSTDRLLKGKAMILKNTSSTVTTSFEIIDTNWLNLAAKKYQGLFLNFGDVSGDSISDMLIGHVDGTISYYLNTATSETAIPNFQLQTDSFLNFIAITGWATPYIYDVDKDGKNEIYVGTKKGNVYRIINNGSITSPNFVVVDTTFGGTIFGAKNLVFGFSAPQFVKTDDTNQVYLVSGNGDGTIERYTGFDTNPVNLNLVDTVYSSIKNITRTVTAFEDFNGDGMMELVVGVKTGGLLYYNQIKKVGATDALSDIQVYNYFNVFPNPAYSQLNIEPIKNDINKFQFEIFDITGKLVLKNKYFTTNNQKINLDLLSEGTYFYKIGFGSKTQNGKFIKLK